MTACIEAINGHGECKSHQQRQQTEHARNDVALLIVGCEARCRLAPLTIVACSQDAPDERGAQRYNEQQPAQERSRSLTYPITQELDHRQLASIPPGTDARSWNSCPACEFVYRTLVQLQRATE